MSNPPPKQLQLSLVLAVLALLIPSLALSQAPTLVANRDVNVYDSPRNGLFCQAGEKLGVIQAGSELVGYEEIKSFCGLFNRFRYLQITYTLPDGRQVQAYINRKNSDGTDRFHSKP